MIECVQLRGGVYVNKTTIKNIEIRYDDNQNCKIDYIKTVISNNYELFLSMLGESNVLSLVPTDEDDVVYLSDFDSDFYDAVNKIFNNEDNKNLFVNPELMPALYVESLVRKNASNQMSLVQPNPNVNDEMLYSLIAYIYFMKTDTFDNFVNYLKDKKDINKILNWLQNETRFDTYNYLLEITINYLKQNDFEFLDNISSITNMMLNQSMNNILNQSIEKEIDLPSVTISEVDNLFYEFLQSINAPENWKEMYDDLKNSDKITFENQNKNENIDGSMCYKDDDDSWKILITTDGTIKCFSSLIHEFIHYITMQDEEKLPSFSLSEFPSIFFEKLSAQFLKNKGYQDNIIDKVIKDRNQNNLEIYMGLLPLFNDILRFVNTGPISRDKKVKFYEEHFRILQETNEKLAQIFKEGGASEDELTFLEKPKINIESCVDEECDSLIDSFIKNGLLVVNGYQYLLDTYLSDEVLKKSDNDPTIINKMIQITDTLSNTNLSNILVTFEMEDLFNQSNLSNKSNTKVK